MTKSPLSFSNLKVGLTVFIGLVIFFIFIFLVGTQGTFFSKTYQLKMFVTDVQGLSNGSLVSLGGLKIGDVGDIKFNSLNGENGIVITLNIKNDFQQQITENSSAQIKTLGLLGDKFVDISLGQPNEPPLKDGNFIHVKKTLTLDAFTEKIQPALEDFTQVLNNLKAITDSISKGQGSLGKLINSPNTAKNLETIVDDLRSFTDAVVNQKGSLGKLAYDNSLFENLNSVAKNLNKVSTDIKNGKGTLGKLLSEDSLYVATNSIAKKLNNLLAKTESDSTVVGGLFNDNKLYTKLNSVLTELNNLVIDLREHPERYVNISVF